MTTVSITSPGGALGFLLVSRGPSARLLREMQNMRGRLPEQEILRLMQNPWMVLFLLAGLGLVVPLIEETAKSIVPALAGYWAREAASSVFLWGVAVGAGFAVVEGMLNGSLDTHNWSLIALVRVGSSAMHCLGSGLTGWGWGQVWAHRRWMRLLAAYAAAIGLHGIWNAVSIGLIVADGSASGSTIQAILGNGAVMALALLTLGAITTLLLLAKSLAQPAEPQAPAPTPVQAVQVSND